MKKAIRLWSFLAIALSLVACQEGPKKENLTKEVKEIVFEAPKQIISLEEADSLYVNYKNRRAETIIKLEAENQEDDKPFVPTQFVSFDIDVLKDYIGYVEQEANKGGAKVDSIRIYLGNYGNESKKYKRKNTLFMLPAAKAQGNYGGIYIGDDGKAKLISNLFKNTNNEEQKQRSEASITPNFKSYFMSGGSSLILNEGGLSPPPKPDF